MADLVIDEWLWADLQGSNAARQQGETFKFLEAIYKKCDRIVIVKGSQFDLKFLGLFDRYNVVRNRLASYYKDYFRYNSLKTNVLEEDQLADLPQGLAAQVKEEDQYLVRAFLTSGASEIVTTDIPLKDALGRNSIRCSYRDEFVREYISRYG